MDEMNAVGPSTVMFTRSDIPAVMSLLAGIGDSAREKVNGLIGADKNSSSSSSGV